MFIYETVQHVDFICASPQSCSVDLSPGKTEAQRGRVIFLRSHNLQAAELKLNAILLISNPFFIPLHQVVNLNLVYVWHFTLPSTKPWPSCGLRGREKKQKQKRRRKRRRKRLKSRRKRRR